MELFEHLALGLNTAMAPSLLVLCFAGVLLGTLVGVLPGLGPVSTIALLLPFTFSLSPTAAMITLAGIYYGAQYGGSITAILVNLPGEASSAVTCIDGHAMAREGRAGTALAVAAIGSFVGGTTGTLLLAALSTPLAAVAARFEAADYAALMACGLVAAIVLARGSLLKAIAMVMAGLLLGAIGLDIATGQPRFTFGIPAAVRRHRFRAARNRIVRSCGDHGRVDQATRVARPRSAGVQLRPSPRRSSPRGGRIGARNPSRLRARHAARRRPPSRVVRVIRTREEGVLGRPAARQPAPSPALPVRSPPTTRRRRRRSFRC